MNSELIEKVQTLTAEANAMFAEKALALDKELKSKSDFYRWVREQEIAIHQLKYQFSQQVAKLNQEAARINQETRVEIDRLRRAEPALSPQKETPGATDSLSPYSSVASPASSPEKISFE